jgi:hypothetical protein
LKAVCAHCLLRERGSQSLRLVAGSTTLLRVEPSEEIRRVVHRWLVANTEGDADAVMARISEQPGMLAVGSDNEEWWHAAERAVWRRQIEESGGFPSPGMRSRRGRKAVSGGLPRG